MHLDLPAQVLVHEMIDGTELAAIVSTDHVPDQAAADQTRRFDAHCQTSMLRPTTVTTGTSPRDRT